MRIEREREGEKPRELVWLVSGCKKVIFCEFSSLDMDGLPLTGLGKRLVEIHVIKREIKDYEQV